MPPDLTPLHPDLRPAMARMPRLTFGRWSLPLIRTLAKLQPRPKLPAGVRVERRYAPTADGTHRVPVRVYRPQPQAGAVDAQRPVLVWLHGGGFVMGQPEMGDPYLAEWVRALGIVVVAVDYRLAPKHPFPTPLEDCYAALAWVAAEAQALGVNPARIAVGGESAGGGLAATLVQLAYDRGQIPLVFQLLVYPMLDDRSALRTDVPHVDVMTWTPASNRFGWESYLGCACGTDNPPAYAVGARRTVLAKLPPAWLGVGTLDLFYAEDVAYAQALQGAGVACELVVVPGANHGFDIIAPDAAVVRAFRQSQVDALRRYLVAPNPVTAMPPVNGSRAQGPA